MKRARTWGCALLAAGAMAMATGTSHSAWAQPRPERVPSPGRSVAGSDDSTALVVNPANLSAMPGAEMRWTWVRTGNSSPSAARGHSFAVAGALPFGLGTGFRLDFVRPPDSTPEPFDEPFTWLTWGLSFGSDVGGLGLALSHVYSSDPRVGGPTSISLGWTGRLSPYMGVAAVAHDLNGPRTFRGTEIEGAYLDRSYTFGTAIRPFASRVLEVGLEGRYYEDLARAPSRDERWVPRATLGLDVPYIGRLRGDVSVFDVTTSDRTYAATALLDLSASNMTLTGGGIFGTALGGADGAGFITGVAMTSWREPGIPDPSYALQIRIEETPTNRGHVAFLRKLWKVSEDSEIAAVVLHIKTSPASSLSHAYELDDAVRFLKARGKKVVCHLEDAGNRALHTCANADRIVVNPAGGIRFAGLYTTRTYLAGVLRKLGIRAEFVRIGKHKSAPEMFTRMSPSDPARQMYSRNLAQTENEFITHLARARKVGVGTMRRSIADGPFTAPEALRNKLVDGYAYDDELRTVVAEVLGREVPLREHTATRAPDKFGLQRRLAIVYVDGNIVDGRSRTIPLIGMRLAGSYTLAETLKDVREDPMISAIVLRIESPGGSSMGSDVIWREVALTAKHKPVIVSMGGVAASGGYYVAVPAKVIYASPYTVTGSIGIFYGKADITHLMKKIGVNVEVMRTAPRADAESIYRPFTKEEIRVLGDKVKQFYDVFVDRVARTRPLTAVQVDAVGRGQVWMGRKAMDHRLVDKIGGIRQAVAEARRLGNLADDSPVVELPPPDFSLLKLAASMAHTEESSAEKVLAAAVPGQVGQMLRAVAPFVVYAPDQPLALCEISEAP